MDIRELLNQLADQEQQLEATQFLAPCVRQGKIRTRVAGLLYTFMAQDPQFEGWGIFQPVNERIAQLIEPAEFFQVADYLQQFPEMRLRLAKKLKGQSWLTYPMNEADMQQRMGRVKPVVVHLVTEGDRFEQIIARYDGSAFWFEAIDRRADPQVAEALQTAFADQIPVEQLQWKGLTPEMRSVYQLVTKLAVNSAARSDEARLQQALRQGGGILEGFQDRGDYWMVEWTTANGESHTSAIAKQDLTVVSSGICLSGRDREFDLQSLVGVIEQRE